MRVNHRNAVPAAERIAHLISLGPPVGWHLFKGYSSVAEVYLALWEASDGGSPAEREVLARSARQACKDMQRFAKVFLFGRPRAYLWQGWYHWLCGKARKACKAWQVAIVEAERLEMPYERGLAHYQIGRHLDAGDPTRREHLTRAAEIFASLETAYDLARVRAMLQQT